MTQAAASALVSAVEIPAVVGTEPLREGVEAYEGA
jgi:hypothetical protein